MKDIRHFSRQERILAMVHENTVAMLERPAAEREWTHASMIAKSLCLDRSNVARELNKLYRDGQLIKILGKPTLYISRSALSERYPNTFFPSTMPKSSCLNDYAAESSANARPSTVIETSSLEAQVGAHKTLQSAILYAKGAVMYPSHNLHTLIDGSTGTGKARFAHLMYTHAVSNGSLSPNAPFIVVNCRGHKTSSQLFLSQLFGYTRSAVPDGQRSRRGLIEKAAGGMICLNGIEELPPTVQEALVALLEKNTYTRIGEAFVTRYINTMIIATSTKSPDSLSIPALQQCFPVHIHIPDLKEWSMRELFEIIIQTFQKESTGTGLSFRMSGEIFACLLKAPYPGNLVELSNVIRTTCALAFLDFSSKAPRLKNMEICFRHLPSGILNNIYDVPATERQIKQLFSELCLEYIDFTPNDFVTNRFTSAQLFKLLHEGPATSRTVSDVPKALSTALKYTKAYFDIQSPNQIKQSSDLSDRLSEKTVGKVRQILAGQPIFSPLIENPADLMPLTACLSDITNGLLPRIPAKNISGLLKDLSLAFPAEASAASALCAAAAASASDSDMIHIIVCLYLMNQNLSSALIPILAVFHGHGIAQAMAEYVNTALKRTVVTGINYDSKISFAQFLEKVYNSARHLNHGRGILIATDMDPLTNLHKYVFYNTGIQAETISNVSLPSLLSISQYALNNNLTLYNLADKALTIIKGETARSNSNSSSFINRTVNELLVPSLTFLNAQKAIEVLHAALDGILKEFSIIQSNELTIKFIFHCSHMLERLIRGDMLKYNGLKTFINQHSSLMTTLEKQMRYPAEIFGVSVPASELAYILEILLPYL